jgi:succinate dehydrogenase/fumarate reductase flavoprotein subunit
MNASPEMSLPHMETDVLIIGYGFAGAVAAITAHDCGAKVVIVEKMPRAGGNSYYSAGNFGVVRPRASAAFAQYLDRLNLGMTPYDVFEAYAQGSEQLEKWLSGLGGELVPRISALANTFPGVVEGPAFPKIAPSRNMFDIRVAKGPAGLPPALRMWDFLSRNVSKRGIEIQLSCRARELTRAADGAIVGAVVEHNGQLRRISANRAVVLTCGGFENAPELLNNFVASKPIMFAGSPGNTGDGVRMAQLVGADLWHMAQTATLIGYKAAEYDAAFCIFFRGPGFIYVDKYGERYVDETAIELHDFDRVFSHFDPVNIEYPRIPSWAIFNEKTLKAGPLTWSIAGYNRDIYQWSADNQAEIDRDWIVKAATLDLLAERLGLHSETLKNTFFTYNSACETGKDSVFDREPTSLEQLMPPFYAIPLHPVMVNTQGGPKRDARARVIDPNNNPIPRLYAAGELGSIWGPLYDGAGNLTECLVFGRIAGQNASRETPRDSWQSG